MVYTHARGLPRPVATPAAIIPSARVGCRMTEPSAIQAESTRRRRWKKRVIRIATGVLILWLASTALTDWIMTRRFRGPRPEPMPALPGVEIQEQRLITSDYENLGAWFIRGPR